MLAICEMSVLCAEQMVSLGGRIRHELDRWVSLFILDLLCTFIISLQQKAKNPSDKQQVLACVQRQLSPDAYMVKLPAGGACTLRAWPDELRRAFNVRIFINSV